MDVATWQSVLSTHPRDGHCRLCMKNGDILRVVEVVWYNCHTPRHMPWWIYIQYAHIENLYSSRKQCKWPHDSQYFPSTQGRVTVGWLCKNLVFKGWLKWCGAVSIPQRTCHGEFTSNMHLHQACAAPGSNGYGHMTLSIIQYPSDVHCSLGMQKSSFQRMVEVV